jgi:hypothetical protein
MLFFNFFRRKNCKKLQKMAVLTQNKAKLCKILTITLVFEQKAIFFAQNWQKSQKIVIITSVPGRPERGPQSSMHDLGRYPHTFTYVDMPACSVWPVHTFFVFVRESLWVWKNSFMRFWMPAQISFRNKEFCLCFISYLQGKIQQPSTSFLSYSAHSNSNATTSIVPDVLEFNRVHKHKMLWRGGRTGPGPGLGLGSELVGSELGSELESEFPFRWKTIICTYVRKVQTKNIVDQFEIHLTWMTIKYHKKP